MQQMSIRTQSRLLLLVASIAIPTVHARPPVEFCRALRDFVESVQPDEKRSFMFRTSWGSNFKDDQKPALYAMRCEHDGYDPAKAVCRYLAKYGSIEFTWIDVKDAISCLSRKTRFEPLLRINSGDFSFTYGSDHRGALIDIQFNEDPHIGGMVFKLTADGY